MAPEKIFSMPSTSATNQTLDLKYAYVHDFRLESLKPSDRSRVPNSLIPSLLDHSTLFNVLVQSAKDKTLPVNRNAVRKDFLLTTG